jgi:hypothetical protein
MLVDGVGVRVDAHRDHAELGTVHDRDAEEGPHAHTRHEAERWSKRLEQLGRGESEFDKKEVAGFWNNIMEEHARFVIKFQQFQRSGRSGNGLALFR